MLAYAGSGNRAGFLIGETIMGLYITTTGAKDIADQVDAILIQVNGAYTGTITCQAGGTTFAVITNPTVGSQYKYGNLRGRGKVTVNPSTSTACDLYVTNLFDVR